jgi:xanthine/uracil permease
VIIVVGISLYKTAVGYMAGGNAASPLYGTSLAWGVSLFTLAVVIVLGNFGKGVFKVSATLFGLLIGYAVALAVGMVDFSQVGTAAWVSVPRPFHFGMSFVPSAIIGMIVIFVINTVKEIGVFEAAASTAYGRLATEKEISGGLVANNISSMLGAVLAGVPNANAAQNIGIVGSSKITDRIVFVLTAVFILITAFIPKLSAIFLTLPMPVLGGATIMVFGSIMMTGVRVLVQAGMTNRNVAISGLSIALAVGIAQSSGAFAHTPAVIQALFGGSEIIAVAASAILLNLILPQEKTA